MLYIQRRVSESLEPSCASMILPNAQPIIFLEYKSPTENLVRPVIFFSMNVRNVYAPFLIDSFGTRNI